MLLNATLVYANSKGDEDELDDLINRPLVPDHVSTDNRALIKRNEIITLQVINSNGITISKLSIFSWIAGNTI